MNDIVVRRNIQRYRNLLDFESDEMRRRILLELLVEEESKLAERLMSRAGWFPCHHPYSACLLTPGGTMHGRRHARRAACKGS
jgi:hypothetical protein